MCFANVPPFISPGFAFQHMHAQLQTCLLLVPQGCHYNKTIFNILSEAVRPGAKHSLTPPLLYLRKLLITPVPAPSSDVGITMKEISLNVLSA